MLIKSTLIALIAVGAISLTACDSDTKDSANKTVEKTKEAAQAAGETVQNASKEVVKETKDAANATGEAASKAVDDVKEATGN
ncbi:MAG: hypothetical protein U9Q75_10285 [Pseudomonadota bacterium]|nr:hypothetical protein [Pseudomonadota bacterium]